MSALARMFNDEVQAARASRGNVLPDAVRRLQGFDAMPALDATMRGAASRARAEFDDSLMDLRGASVRTGRLSTGFFDEDAGRLFRRVNEGLDNTIASASMNALAMQQANDARLVGVGQQQEQQFLDLLSGGLDRETAERNARRQSRGNALRSLTSLAGAGLGFMLGGPAGAAMGGSMAGSLFGGSGSRGVMA
jgi:hypothetical protein